VFALEIQNLSIRCGVITLLDRISLSIKKGSVHALLGPSGSGKSLIAKAVVQLLPPGLSMSGTILIDGAPFSPSMRGSKVGLIFQDPAAALNPTLKVGEQIADGIRRHHPLKDAKKEAIKWMEKMQIHDAKNRYNHYPYQLSGGQLQRAHIASLIALQPSLLIADEITTALDPTTAVQILHLIYDIVEQEGLALLWITHDKKTVLTDQITYISNGRVVDAVH
jgi:ABC-type dipeptide/oligopeptide/nickel transport system ATPase component